MRLVGFAIAAIVCGYLGLCGEFAVHAQENTTSDRGSTRTRPVNLCEYLNRLLIFLNKFDLWNNSLTSSSKLKLQIFKHLLLQSRITRTLTLLFPVIINEESNKVANSSVISALETIKEKYPSHLGKVWSVQVNESDVNDTLDRICSAWDSVVEKGGTRVPDLVIDTTTAGLAAKISNSFTAALGIPTLSAQYGQEGDLLHWRSLNMDQQGYLIQVMPPTDLIPQAIRELCIQLNITNAAILYDQNFVMDHKYKSLLLNVATRHVINEIEPEAVGIKNQLSFLRDLDIVNYFVLGNENVMNAALETAEAFNFTGKKFGWFLLTPEINVSPSCDCKNISALFMRPEFSKKNPTIEPSFPKPVLSSAFYYDLVQLGIHAMKSALDNEDWPMEPEHITCNDYDSTNTPKRKLNFFNRLKEAYKNMTPTYAGIKWGSKNGEHQAKFEMSVHLVDIKDGVVSNDIEGGSWNASISTPLQVTLKSGIEKEQRTSLSNCIADFLSFYIFLSSSSFLFSSLTFPLFVILSIYV